MASNPNAAIRLHAFSNGSEAKWFDDVESRIVHLLCAAVAGLVAATLATAPQATLQIKLRRVVGVGLLSDCFSGDFILFYTIPCKYLILRSA